MTTEAMVVYTVYITPGESQASKIFPAAPPLETSVSSERDKRDQRMAVYIHPTLTAIANSETNGC